MIVCKSCGYQNEDDDAFCGSCGTFLEWAGEPLTEPEPKPRPEPEPEPKPEKARFLGRLKSTLGIGGERRPDGEVPAADEQKQPEATAGSGNGPPVGVLETRTPEAAGVIESETPAEDEQPAGGGEHPASDSRSDSPRIQLPREETTGPVSAATSMVESPLAPAEQSALKTLAADVALVLPEAEAEKANAREEAERRRADEEARKREEETAREAAKAKAREEAERRAREEAKAREEAAKAREEAAKAREEAAKAREEAAKALEEAERKAREEAEAREEAKAREEAEARRQHDEGDTLRVLTAAEQQERRDGAAALIEALIERPLAGPAPDLAAQPPEPKESDQQTERPARQRVKTPPTRTIPPGGLVCGHCGEVNDPACRTCGESLVNAVRYKPDEAQAGRQVRRGFQSRRILSLLGRLATILVVVGVASLSLPDVRGAVFPLPMKGYCAVKMRLFPEFHEVSAVAVWASGKRGHGAGKMIDGSDDTHWAETGPGQGEGELITLFFDAPADFDQISFRTGILEGFSRQPRPAEITVRFLNAQGRVVSEEKVNLLDTMNQQPVEVSGVGAKTIQMTIDSVYEGEGGHALAIREIEFRAKSC